MLKSAHEKATPDISVRIAQRLRHHARQTRPAKPAHVLENTTTTNQTYPALDYQRNHGYHDAQLFTGRFNGMAATEARLPS